MPAAGLEIEQSLHRYLIALAGVQALCNGPAGIRVSPWKTSQGEPSPRVTYQMTSAERIEALSGPVGMSRPVFLLRCWGRSMEEAKTLAAAIRGTVSEPALDGFRDWLGGRESGHFVQCARVKDAMDDPEEPIGGDDRGDPCVALEVQLFYEEG